MGLEEELVGRFREELTCTLCGCLFANPHLFPGCNHAFCYECVLHTLEGPGIKVSQCPTCKQPGWKKELQPAHKLSSLVDHLRTLLMQMGMPLQAEVEDGRSGSMQQQGTGQGNGGAPKPASRRKAGSKAPLSSSGQKKRKKEMQQEDAEGREGSTKLLDRRTSRKQVRFADHAHGEAPAADALLHAQGEYPSEPAAGDQSAQGQGVLGADMANDMADGASDLADWEVPNTYPIAPDGCELMPGLQPHTSLIKAPAPPVQHAQPESAEPRQGSGATAPEMAPAAICSSKRQLSSRPDSVQQCGSGGAGAGTATAEDDDDFQEAPGKVCSRGGATVGMGKQRRQRGIAKELRLDLKRNAVEQKSSRKVRSISEQPSVEERPVRLRAEAKRAQRRQDGVFARLFAAEAALPTEDARSSPPDSPAAATSPAARSSRANSTGCTGDQQRQLVSSALDEVPDSASLGAEPTAAPAAASEPDGIEEHMRPPGAAAGTTSTNHLEDEVLGTCSAEAGPADGVAAAADAETRRVRSAAPAGPDARQAGSPGDGRTSSQDPLRHVPDGPSSAGTPCGVSDQEQRLNGLVHEEDAEPLTVPETPHAELALGQRRSARTPLPDMAAPAYPPQDALADGGGRAAMSALDINALGARIAQQVAIPKTAEEANALRQAREDAERLLAQLQRMCLERGLLLPPEGPGSFAADVGAGRGGGTDRQEDLSAGGEGGGGPGVGGPAEPPSLLLDTMPLMGTERSLAEIDEAMRARGYRFSTLEDMQAA